MLKIFIGFFVFCLVLFIYLHINFHLKTGNDLEIYEIEQGSKDKLEEICDLRQPVMFDFDNEKIIEYSNKTYLLDNYPAFEIKIRNSKDPDYNSEIYMPLPLHAAAKLVKEDTNSTYFSENNADFLQETGIIKSFQYNDAFLRPYMVSNCNYDVLIGSQNTITPFRYELNYRNYFLVTEGTIQIKMAPPKSLKYLYTVYDYENFEFRSPVNAWKPQKQYVADFDKIKCLEITLTPGKTIQIPAYWWYSIKFSKDSSISCFKYRTYMNNIAITPHIAMYTLQLQNIKRDTVKKMDVSHLDQTNKSDSDTENTNNTTNIDDLDNDLNNDLNNEKKIEETTVEEVPMNTIE